MLVESFEVWELEAKEQEQPSGSSVALALWSASRMKQVLRLLEGCGTDPTLPPPKPQNARLGLGPISIWEYEWPEWPEWSVLEAVVSVSTPAVALPQ